MTTMEIVQDVLAENLGIDAAEIAPESTLESLGVDSLDMVELTCDIEDRCGVEFGNPEGLSTIADIVAHIDSLK